jgi:hypothetical protein
MDYLPILSYSGVQHLRVPFRPTLTLDANCLFAEFPDRHGFRSCGQLNLDRPETNRGFRSIMGLIWLNRRAVWHGAWPC